MNQYIASELDWPEKGIRLVQDTRFPVEETVRLTVRAARPRASRCACAYPPGRPGGSVRGSTAGRSRGVPHPGGYFALDRLWSDGDLVTVRLPLRLHAPPIPDDPSLQAVLYGPLVLAAAWELRG